jgi:hypothetical protein
LRVNDPDATAYVHYLLSYYELDLYSTDMKRARRMGGLPYSGLPHDMMYTNPVTLVFKRNHG